MRLSVSRTRLYSLALNLVGASALSATAVTQSIWVFVSLSISSATSLKLGEILPRTLNYFWKQNDLCPTEDFKDWSSPTTLPILVSIVLSHGLRGKLWFLCHRSPPSYLVPGSVDPLVDSPLYRLDLPMLNVFPPPCLQRILTFSWDVSPLRNSNSSGVRSLLSSCSL